MVENASSQYLIAVGLDGSESSWKAFEEALQQAKLKEASLHVVSIHESAEASPSALSVLAAEDEEKEKLERMQIKARMQAESRGMAIITAILAGSSAGALVDYTKRNHINLLVIGDTGHSSLWGALLGTTAEKIVRNAPCSVLIVR